MADKNNLDHRQVFDEAPWKLPVTRPAENDDGDDDEYQTVAPTSRRNPSVLTDTDDDIILDSLSRPSIIRRRRKFALMNINDDEVSESPSQHYNKRRRHNSVLTDIIDDDDEDLIPVPENRPMRGQLAPDSQRTANIDDGEEDSDGESTNMFVAEEAKKKTEYLTRYDMVAEASLAKRHLKAGEGSKVCKRGSGHADPENIAVVNMKERHGMKFQAISDELNKRRVKEGREPSHTVCSVSARYQRTAHVLFRSQGLQFVSLADRKRQKALNIKCRHGEPLEENQNPLDTPVRTRKSDQDALDTEDVASPVPVPQVYSPMIPIADRVTSHENDVPVAPRGPLANYDWTPDKDLTLVRLHQKYEAGRWTKIAEQFNASTGFTVTPEQVALRFHTL